VRVRENLTIPNFLSLLRLAMLPTFVGLFADGRVVAGSWFFGLLAATDFVDGYIARRFNQVSELGKILDPIADRLVFFVGIGAAMYYDYLPVRCLGLPWDLPGGTGWSSLTWGGQLEFLESLSLTSHFLIICPRCVRTWHLAEGPSEYR
jgi:hypothetical protein